MSDPDRIIPPAEIPQTEVEIEAPRFRRIDPSELGNPDLVGASIRLLVPGIGENPEHGQLATLLAPNRFGYIRAILQNGQEGHVSVEIVEIYKDEQAENDAFAIGSGNYEPQPSGQQSSRMPNYY